jgi:hypothetical protein
MRLAGFIAYPGELKRNAWRILVSKPEKKE